MKTIMTRMKHRLQTASSWSKAVGLVALNVALLFTTGCASMGKVAPIAQRLPRGSSCVALLSMSMERQLRTGVPSMKLGPIADGSKVIGLGPAKAFLEGGGTGDKGDSVILAATLAWIPAGALFGAAYGAATSVEDGEIQSSIQIAGKFASRCDFEAELMQKMSDVSWSGHAIGLNTFTATGPDLAHVSMSQRGFRHIIQIEIGPVRLDGDYLQRNPRVRLTVNVTAKLYRLHGTSREEVHMVEIRYRGDKERFVRLMAEDAKALRAEVDKCQRTIAAQILAAFAE